MNISKPAWAAVIIILVPAMWLGLNIFEDLHYEWLSRKWEAQIKREQDPEALRKWALQLLMTHDRHKSDDMLTVTDRPPSGIPISDYGPTIKLHYGGQPNVSMTWDKAARIWGLEVGDTNFVGATPGGIWKAGIYFYQEP